MRNRIAAALLAAFMLAGPVRAARAETVRITQQYGISYLPLMVMQEEHLLEAAGKQRGLHLDVEWTRFTGGTPINEALISGNIDFASGGVAPMLTIWARTRHNLKVKGLTALNAMPLWLNTSDPAVKSIKDFTDKDRIALPAVKTSIQAVTLQMAAEQAFGPGHEHRLDPLTVSMSHPDGMTALLSGSAQITGHFTSAPYMYEELKDPKIHRVLNSYDVLGGPHTFNVVWTTTRYHDAHPKVIAAFLAALQEAMTLINKHPDKAAAIWLQAEPGKLTAAQAEAMIRRPENEWTMVPKKIMAYAAFMKKTGAIPVAPADWQDAFFPDIKSLPGS